jgi:Cullin family.
MFVAYNSFKHWIFGNYQEPAVYVEALLNFYRKMRNVLESSFKSDASFEAALEKVIWFLFIIFKTIYLSQGCRRVINNNAVTEIAKNVSKSSELIARQLDSLLRAKPTLEDNEKDRADDEIKIDDLVSYFFKNQFLISFHT